MTSPTPKPGILDIELYVGGRSAVPGVAKVFKLSSNESPLGPSPKAVTALAAAAHDLALYPDGSSKKLRDAIAAKDKDLVHKATETLNEVSRPYAERVMDSALKDAMRRKKVI